MGVGIEIPTTNVLKEYTQLPYLTAVWEYDGSTYQDYTLSAQSTLNSSTSFSVLTMTEHVLYFGSESRFDSLIFEGVSGGGYSNIQYYIWTGNLWTRIQPRIGYDYSYSGGDFFPNLSFWKSTAFTDTIPHAVEAVPDNRSRYYMKMTATVSSGYPLIKRIRCNPIARYTTPTKVAALLSLPEFTEATTPTYNQIEDIIHRKQDEIDYRTKKSWKYNFVLDEYHEFNLMGQRLTRKPIIEIIKLEIWTGGGMETKTLGRTNDYFFIPDTGEVYYSRFFMLPARLAFTGPHWWGWGIGEFTYAVRISYIWGRDLETDGQGYIAEDIATKLTAIDLYTNHDYSLFTVGGTDRVPFDRKIENWKIETEDKMESLRSIEVW